MVLDSIKKFLLKDLASQDQEEKIVYLEEEGKVIAQIPFDHEGFTNYVQIGFRFEGDKLERINSVGTNISIAL